MQMNQIILIISYKNPVEYRKPKFNICTFVRYLMLLALQLLVKERTQFRFRHGQRFANIAGNCRCGARFGGLTVITAKRIVLATVLHGAASLVMIQNGVRFVRCGSAATARLPNGRMLMMMVLMLLRFAVAVRFISIVRSACEL